MIIKKKNFKQTSFILGAVLVLYTLAGFFLLPILGKNILMDRLSTSLDREVFIEKIFINPYAFTAAIDALVVKDKNKGVFCSAEKISADLSFFSLFAFTLGISDISLENPCVNIVRNADGTFNFSDLLNPGNQDETLSKDTPGKEEEKKPGELIPFVLKNVRISQGEIRFNDKANDVSHLVENFSLALPVLSSREKNRTEKSILDIDFILNHAKVDIHVESTPFAEDLATQVNIRTSDIDVIHYLSYLPIPEKIRLKAMDLNLDFHAGYRKADSKDSFMVQGTLNALNAVVKGGAEEEIIKFPSLTIDFSPSNILDNQLNISKVLMVTPQLTVNRGKSGKINLLNYISNNGESLEKKEDKKTATTGQPSFRLNLADIEIKDGAVFFQDLSNTDPVKINLSNISINVADFKNWGEEKVRVAAQMNWGGKGRISIKGNVIPSMVRAGLDISLEKIDIKSLQPYFTDAVKILVTDGQLNTKGKLDLDMSSTPREKITFAGETSLTNFISLDKQTAMDFFKCNSLYFSGLDVSVFPVTVKVKDISLTDFYSRIIVSDTGDINLNTIFQQESGTQGGESEKKQEKKPEKSSSQAPQIRVDNITLQGGDIRFSDYLTQPNFTAGMKQIAGSVTGLSSDEQSRAKLFFKGIHGQSSPLDISGTINPLAENKFADIDISFKDIELINFTPYSSKYLGYKIEKGKLVLDLQYSIDGNKLTSENRVRFDNFSLGERVESEDATSLPVGLAISLLKNRNGQINLDLPVSGQLDDPEFKIGSIVLKMISNLVLKVVTSPFSVIGAMFGGGAELGYVEFEYGDATINAPDYEKLDKLALILQEKSSVNLEIQGFYDDLRDTEVLRIKGFENLIKAEKIKELSASGTDAGTLQDVVISKEDMPYYIDMAYARAQFPKPRDEAGNEKQLDIEEKKKLLMTNINIGKDDLRLLSMSRSENIKAYLISTGKVEKERIFLLEPLGNENSNTQRASRVKFLLK